MQSLTNMSDTSNLAYGGSDETCVTKSLTSPTGSPLHKANSYFLHPVFLLFFALFLAALAYGGFFDRLRTNISASLENYFLNAGVVLQKIHIEGQVRLKDEQIIAALGIRAGQSFFGFDAKKAQKRLSKLGQVKSVRVMRLLPSMLLVQVEERQPLARWLHDDRMVLIDDTGIVLQKLARDASSPFPLVVGAGAHKEAATLIRVLSNHPGLAEQIRLAEYIGGYRWDLQAKNGAVIKLPRRNLALGLARFVSLPGWRKLLASKDVVVDLRQTTQAFVNIKSAKTDYQRARF